MEIAIPTLTGQIPYDVEVAILALKHGIEAIQIPNTVAVPPSASLDPRLTTVERNVQKLLLATPSGTVSVDPAGAITGDGSAATPLKVAVDGSTVSIVGDKLVATAGGAGITRLTGGVTAGPGVGSVVATVVSVAGASGLLVTPQTPAAHAASHASGGSDPVTVTTLAGFPGGTTTFLRADGSFAAPAGASHALLDGSVDSDTVAYVVVRGSMIVGNSTPKWGGLVVGATGTMLASDGTDPSWSAAPTLTTSLTVPTLHFGTTGTCDFSSTLTLIATTADGADAAFVRLAGGGAALQSRGAFFEVHGNEAPSTGSFIGFLGNVAGAQFRVLNAGGIAAFTVDANTSQVGIVGAGSAATPAFVSNSDLNTGLYWDNSDGLYFATNGTQRFTITATGRLQSTQPGDIGGPVYSYTSGTNTGMYFPSATAVAFATAGAARVTIGPGMQVGAPTGGDLGAGTINVATKISLNNTAYTNPDYALEHYFTGRIERYRHNPGADSYPGLQPLATLRSTLAARYRFPQIERLDSTCVFTRSDIALELLEEAHLYILELHDRITRLEQPCLNS